MKGTLDNLLDVRDALDREDCFYVLVVGRIGEDRTHVWMCHKGNLDRTTEDHVQAVVNGAFEEERKEEGTTE